eukprot:m.34866 g.34866  ORF g.34866 m.34866 type:complete len:308 (+) comp14336_c0_seq2:188-1111(+)
MDTDTDSEYERLRLLNIEQNRKALLALGLDVVSFTTAAVGTKAPIRRKSRPLCILTKAPTGLKRRSARLLQKSEHDHAETSEDTHKLSLEYLDVVSDTLLSRKRRRTIPKSLRHPSPCVQSKSCRCLRADHKSLAKKFLGKVIPPVGGQVKRAAMDVLSAEGAPVFSNMSGIQEWVNAVALFVNIYGSGYKNVFLEQGRKITWFAQSQQWEGSPVIQRMIYSSGALVTSDETQETTEFAETPIVLFCRTEGKGYVYCGELQYIAHEPERVPIRFVWQLKQFNTLRMAPDFVDLVKTCAEVLGRERAI